MTANFNQASLKLNSEIKEHCALYQSNHRAFCELIRTAKSRNTLNSNDLKQSEHLISQMNNGEMIIIFCGQVKSGKSRCVMEFLSGAINLPSKDTPATAVFSKLFYSDKPVIYSENSRGEKEYHKFDGINVNDDLVGKRQNFMIEERDLDLIYHIGISNQILQGSVVIVDSPGLNETQSLDDAFKVNLVKINPQIVIYIFDYGPGFIDRDNVYYTTVIANLRKNLRKVFVFNKFDEAFKVSYKFPKGDDSDDSGSDILDSDDDESKDFLKEYELQYVKHKRNMEEGHCGIVCPYLVGYSGKFTQLHRQKKEKRLLTFRDKHLELMEHVRCNINSANIETIESILSFTNQIIFSEFKLIFKQILDSENTNQRQVLLSGADKEKLLTRFDLSHDKLVNIIISQIPQINFDGAISQIVKNQERIQTELSETKFTNLVTSLAKFFIDRYVNYFSNIILTKLEEISFNKLIDDLKQKGLDHLLSHIMCALSSETEKMKNVIKLYFDEEASRIIYQNETVEKNEFSTSEACTFYIKNNFKYQKEFIWVNVSDFIRNVILAEREHLEKSIEEKKKEIITTFKISKDQSNEMIGNAVILLKKLFVFHNNYVIELSKKAENKSGKLEAENKKEFLTKIIDGTVQNKHESNCQGLVVKTEEVNLEDLSYDNCELIKYFLRCQYLRSDTCGVSFYYWEKEGRLCFITNVEDLRPLRQFLSDGVTEAEKVDIVKKLIAIVQICYDKCLYIDNLGPDMIFCRKSSSGIEIKVVEAAQIFREWKYTLRSGVASKFPPHQYPFYQSETAPSMFYSLSWIILIVLHGSCDEFFTDTLNISKITQEIEKGFPTLKEHHIYTKCCKIIKLCCQRPFKMERMNDIIRIFED